MAFGTKNWNSSACPLLLHFESHNCISCLPIMQSLLRFIAQSQLGRIYNSKTVEVTGALYWLLVRRTGTHLLVSSWCIALKLTTAFLVDRSCRAFLASWHKLKRIGYIIARRQKWPERSIGFWYEEVELIGLSVLAPLWNWQLHFLSTDHEEPSLLHGTS